MPTCPAAGRLDSLPRPLLPSCSHHPRRPGLPALPRALLPQGLCTTLTPAGCFSHDSHVPPAPGQPAACSCVASPDSPSWTPLLAAPCLLLCPFPTSSNPEGPDSVLRAPEPSGFWLGSAGGSTQVSVGGGRRAIAGPRDPWPCSPLGSGSACGCSSCSRTFFRGCSPQQALETPLFLSPP